MRIQPSQIVFLTFRLSHLALHYHPIRKELSTSLIKYLKYLYFIIFPFAKKVCNLLMRVLDILFLSFGHANTIALEF